MQYSIIRLSQCSEEERSAIVGDDRQMMIGAATASDLRLHVSFGLPDECLRIRVEKGLCVAENLTGDPGLVFVNGQQVYGIMQLDDGDALQIGSDQFAVVLDNEMPSLELTEASTPEVADDDVTTSTTPASEDVLPQTLRRAEMPEHQRIDALRTRVLNTAVTLHQPADEEQFENKVLADLCKTHNAFLLANFKAGGVKDPGIRVVGEDLLKYSPKTVRGHESLHAVVHPNNQRKRELWEQLEGCDAAVWCFPGEDIQSCLLDIKLYAAWFVRPSVLRSVLQNSSSDFGERLLRSFRLLVLRDDNAEDRWHLYTKPNVQLDRSSNDSLFVNL